MDIKKELLVFIKNLQLESIIIIFSTAGDAIVTNTLGILIWFKATNKEQILKLFTMNAIASSVGNIFKMISA